MLRPNLCNCWGHGRLIQWLQMVYWTASRHVDAPRGKSKYIPKKNNGKFSQDSAFEG